MQELQQTRNDDEKRQLEVVVKEKKVSDVMMSGDCKGRRLVEVPYTATLAHTMNTLVANRVVAVPVAAPPGQWIGAGGSMILESDKQTGAVRKHYIGMVTMLDILAHLAGGVDDQAKTDVLDLGRKMSVPVSSIIGHCLEGLSLWTLNPNTSIVECMEVFSKGIHRALVPVDGQAENVSGVELVESASSYRMITQMDLLKFLQEHASQLDCIISRSVQELGAVVDGVYAITDRTKVIEAIKCMRAGLLNAVPIVKSSDAIQEDHKQLVVGKGRKLIGTFSATDLRGCQLSSLQSWFPQSALEFTEQIRASPLLSSSVVGTSPKELVTCRPESSLAEAMDKAVTNHVHRIWVVEQQQGMLLGLVSLTDMIRVIRASLIWESPGLY